VKNFKQFLKNIKMFLKDFKQFLEKLRNVFWYDPTKGRGEKCTNQKRQTPWAWVAAAFGRRPNLQRVKLVAWLGFRFRDHAAAAELDHLQHLLELLAGVETRQDAADLSGVDLIQRVGAV